MPYSEPSKSSFTMSDFSPVYTWPSKSFPFRLYIDNPKVRIFIIENIIHNYHWLKKYAGGIRPTDYFFVIVGCYSHDWLISHEAQALAALNINQKNFFIMANDQREQDLFRKHGFDCKIINQNAWLDEEVVNAKMDTSKIYDAIYVGRLAQFKRHFLAKKVSNLALVAGSLHSAAEASYVPPHAYKNSSPLSQDEVFEKISSSRCGLILSEQEGACFASSEYLLCGVPVVSTKSEGGRDVWYNESNSIVCEPDPCAISEAVRYFCNTDICSDSIRSQHIDQARQYRSIFIRKLEKVLHANSVAGYDIHRLFYKSFYHKMRKSVVPDFEKIFG
ncbi:MAG: glycosyltransferase [Cyanobium sp.]